MHVNMKLQGKLELQTSLHPFYGNGIIAACTILPTSNPGFYLDIPQEKNTQ